MDTEMDKYIINVHSMVDIITNSSTELFVLDKEKSLEAVKDILQKAIDLYNEANDKNYQFDDIFKEPYIGDPNDALGGWSDYYSSKKKEGIIIMGADDNSVPYWMDNFITDVFDAERFHLG